MRDPGLLVLEDQFVAGRLYRFPNSTPRDNGEITVSRRIDALVKRLLYVGDGREQRAGY